MVYPYYIIANINLQGNTWSVFKISHMGFVLLLYIFICWPNIMVQSYFSVSAILMTYELILC